MVATALLTLRPMKVQRSAVFLFCPFLKSSFTFAALSYSTISIHCDFSHIVNQFLMRKDLSHIQQLLFGRLKATFRKASRDGDAKMLETIVITLGCLGKAATGIFFMESSKT